MKKTIGFFLLATAAIWMSACGAPATNSNTNTNANAKPAAAAPPTKEALLAKEKEANEAWIKGDAKFFDGFLSDKFVSYDMGKRAGKADIAKMIGENKCDIKSWSLDDPQMAMIDADTAVISYKGTFDGTCTGPDGKSMKVPSPTRAASIYVRSGDKWMGAFHGENMIVDPKAAPAPPTADKKDEPKKEEPKKDEAKKEEPKKDDKAAAANSTTADAKPAAGDANTAALMTQHQAGWDAWKAKDSKKFEEMTTASLSIVDPMGGWLGAKADVIKLWTSMKCEGVTSTKVSDGVASALSPTVEILTVKGSSDGTCDGHKNGDLYQTAVYVKEGEAWKLAFMMESAPMM